MADELEWVHIRLSTGCGWQAGIVSDRAVPFLWRLRAGLIRTELGEVTAMMGPFFLGQDGMELE